MVVEADIKRIVKGPADLEERIEQLEKQKEILKAACKKAGETIRTLTKRAQEAEGEVTIVKGIGMNSPEMKALQNRVKELNNSLSIALDINDKYQREVKEVKEDNQKLALQINDLEKKVRRIRSEF